MAKFTAASTQAALAGRKAVRAYPLPGFEGVEVGIRMLSDSEMDSCRLRAQDYVTKRKCELVIDPEMYDRAIHRETIAEAFVDSENHAEPYFSSPEEVSQLDVQCVRACWDLFSRHQMAMDPYSFCPPEEVEELVELLGKSEDGAAALSKLFEPNTQWSFVVSLAKRLRETSAQLKSATG